MAVNSLPHSPTPSAFSNLIHVLSLYEYCVRHLLMSYFHVILVKLPFQITYLFVSVLYFICHVLNLKKDNVIEHLYLVLYCIVLLISVQSSLER